MGFDPGAGFTAVELLLALGLAAVVSLAAFGLLFTVYRAESAGQARFSDEAELQMLQRAVRALSRSVTCKKPAEIDSVDAPVSETVVADIEARLREQMDRSGQPYTPESVRAQAMEEARRVAREQAAARGDEREKIPPRFEVRLDASSSGGAVPVLEALLTESPVPPVWSPDPEERRRAMAGNLVRGVIEGVRSEDFERSGWTLQWRAIEPPAEPVVLARRIAGWEWSVLPRKQHANKAVAFVETAAAWYDSDYPRALRLRVAGMGGTMNDWTFDIPRPIAAVVDVGDGPEARSQEQRQAEGIEDLIDGDGDGDGDGGSGARPDAAGPEGKGGR